MVASTNSCSICQPNRFHLSHQFMVCPAAFAQLVRLELTIFFLIRDIFSELVDDDLKIKTKLMVEALGFHDNSKDSVFQIMKIRKGKKLLARAMPYLPQVIEIKFVTIYYSNSNSDSLGWN